MYQVSQTSLPAYFNYSRWMCCFDLGFTLMILVIACFTFPGCFSKTLDKSQKHYLNIFGVSFFMIFTGLSGISAGGWFSYACYANELGPLIGPGSETDRFQNVSFYTPYWCCVLWIINCCFLVVVGGVFGCRSCCKYGQKAENIEKVEKVQNKKKRVVYDYGTTSDSRYSNDSFQSSEEDSSTNSNFSPRNHKRSKAPTYLPPPSMPPDTINFAYC